MQAAFSQQDWERVHDRLTTAAVDLQAVGASVAPPQILPPIPESQLLEFQASTGLALPEDLSQMLTRFSGGWYFSWNLSTKLQESQIDRSFDVGGSGGNGEVQFIGADESSTLLSRHQELQDFAERWIGNQETRNIIKSSFPLHLFEGGGGDLALLRLDKSPAEIVYLDHEMGWEFGDEHVVARGFRYFLLGWAELAFPGLSYHRSWTSGDGTILEPSSEKAKKWLAWLKTRNLAAPEQTRRPVEMEAAVFLERLSDSLQAALEGAGDPWLIAFASGFKEEAAEYAAAHDAGVPWMEAERRVREDNHRRQQADVHDRPAPVAHEEVLEFVSGGSLRSVAAQVAPLVSGDHADWARVSCDLVASGFDERQGSPGVHWKALRLGAVVLQEVAKNVQAEAPQERGATMGKVVFSIVSSPIPNVPGADDLSPASMLAFMGQLQERPLFALPEEEPEAGGSAAGAATGG